MLSKPTDALHDAYSGCEPDDPVHTNPKRKRGRALAHASIRRVLARASGWCALLHGPGNISLVIAVTCWFVTLGVLGCSVKDPKTSTVSRERTVTVAVAADMKFAMDDIIVQFQQQHPEIQVQATYGSSGNFYSQLVNQAPFDMFLSADVDYPRRLIQKNLARADTEFLYAVGSIVVWVPKDSPIPVEMLGMEALLHPTVRKIAIANPRYAPYGRAAEAAMKSLGVYEKVQNRLVYGESVIQAAHFIESGAADIGIIGHSLAMSPAMRDKGRFWEVPRTSYPRRDQAGVILNGARDRAAAETLRAFILGPAGKAVLHRYGFSLPGE